MSEREELMKVADIWFDETAEKEWPEADTGILADRILQAGFRKTLELGELESFESSEVVKREGPWVHFEDARRLAAPKERWVAPEMMEALAADEHDRWSGQARTALDEMTPERRERWDRLSKTPYAELTEEMKELDRMQVRERLAIMGLPPPPTTPAQTAKEGV